MQLDQITLALFAMSNAMRLIAYLPQIHKAATDKNGASAISCTTWSLFLMAHVSTIAYALVNRSDFWLALCFAGNALGCLVILGIAWWKARRRVAHANTADSSQWVSRKSYDRALGDKHRHFARAAMLQ